MQEPHPPPPPPADQRSKRSTGLLVIGRPIANGDVAMLCERLQAIIATSDAQTIVCDVAALPANTQTVEALARLQLTARRRQRRIRLQRASRDLQQVLAFIGLAGVLPTAREPQRQPEPRRELLSQRQRDPEQREHPPDVEEAVDRDDPPL